MDGDARARAPGRARVMLASLADDARAQLRDDPIAYLDAHPDLEVRRRRAASTGSCWLAGTYRWRSDAPALITLNATDSDARQRFSVLHEFGHHLHQTSAVTADLLDLPSARRRPVEEATCDAFASLAIFGSSIDELGLSAHGPRADDVASLYARAKGSTWATCVAAAATLPHEGWVVVGGLDGRVAFAAPAHLDVGFRPGSGTVEPLPVLEEAARTGHTQRTSSFVLHTGAVVGTYNVDALRTGEHVFAVFTRGPSAWGTAAVSDTRLEDVECEHCEAVYAPYGAACRRCGTVACPRCDRCNCQAVEPRLCPGCSMLQPPACFAATSTLCNDCV